MQKVLKAMLFSGSPFQRPALQKLPCFFAAKIQTNFVYLPRRPCPAEGIIARLRHRQKVAKTKKKSLDRSKNIVTIEKCTQKSAKLSISCLSADCIYLFIDFETPQWTPKAKIPRFMKYHQKDQRNERKMSRNRQKN